MIVDGPDIKNAKYLRFNFYQALNASLQGNPGWVPPSENDVKNANTFKIIRQINDQECGCQVKYDADKTRFLLIMHDNTRASLEAAHAAMRIAIHSYNRAHHDYGNANNIKSPIEFVLTVDNEAEIRPFLNALGGALIIREYRIRDRIDPTKYTPLSAERVSALFPADPIQPQQQQRPN